MRLLYSIAPAHVELQTISLSVDWTSPQNSKGISLEICHVSVKYKSVFQCFSAHTSSPPKPLLCPEHRKAEKIAEMCS